MVSVYDSVLGVNGFIDPNSTLFALYNVDKPNFVDADVNEQTNYGPPIFTGGTVTATGNITSTNGNVAATLYDVTAGRDISAVRNITSTTGNIAATVGAVSAGTTVTAGSNLIATAGGLVITTKGININAGSATAGKLTLVDGSAVVETTAITVNSLIFLSYNDTSLSNPGVLNVSGRSNGISFTIGSTAGASDDNDIVWFIVN